MDMTSFSASHKREINGTFLRRRKWAELYRVYTTRILSILVSFNVRSNFVGNIWIFFLHVWYRFSISLQISSLPVKLVTPLSSPGRTHMITGWEQKCKECGVFQSFLCDYWNIAVSNSDRDKEFFRSPNFPTLDLGPKEPPIIITALFFFVRVKAKPNKSLTTYFGCQA